MFHRRARVVRKVRQVTLLMAHKCILSYQNINPINDCLLVAHAGVFKPPRHAEREEEGD